MVVVLHHILANFIGLFMRLSYVRIYHFTIIMNFCSGRKTQRYYVSHIELFNQLFRFCFYDEE